jgi:hypothetical protein
LKYLLQEEFGTAPEGARPSGRDRSFFEQLTTLLRRPQQILLLWNWKSAWLSILLRAPIFLAVASRHGLSTIVSAVLTECLVCMMTAGFYGAVVQSLKDANPEWLVLLFLTIVVPMVFQAIEFLFHWLHGTPHLRLAAMVSLAVGGVSSLFNWYAMRRGTLLVGGEGDPFGSDLRRLPKLLLEFFLAIPCKVKKAALDRTPEKKVRNLAENPDGA